LVSISLRRWSRSSFTALLVDGKKKGAASLTDQRDEAPGKQQRG
jgi:hypothetical protein